MTGTAVLVERPPTSRASSTLTGTTQLLRLNLRRDRILAGLWLGVLTLLVFASAAATDSLFGTPEQQALLSKSINDQPALVALYGPILDITSAGELAMSKMTVLYALIATIPFVVIVRRHTRLEEESGRAELLGGTCVGRDAPLAAALIEGAGLAVLLGLLAALANIAGGLPAAGSLWFGVSWTGTALVALGIAAVACQLSASARTCASIAAGVLGVLYVVRAVGDISDNFSWLSWLSPLGWNTQLRAWSDTRAWIALLYVATAAILVVLAQVLRSRRDLGSGLIAARPGAVDGTIGSILGLTFRVLRVSLATWTLSCLAMGALFGAIAPGMDDLLDSVADGEFIDRLGGALIAAVLSVVSFVITAFAVGVVSHADSDEDAGRSELVYATATSRFDGFSAIGLVAVLSSAWLMLMTGIGLWVGYGSAGGADAYESVWAALGWVPAIWLVTSLALLGHGLRVGWLGWGSLGLFLTLTMLGKLFELPTWLINLSPYSVIPAYPFASWDWTPELVLTGLSVLIAAAAWSAFSRRDLG